VLRSNILGFYINRILSASIIAHILTKCTSVTYMINIIAAVNHLVTLW